MASADGPEETERLTDETRGNSGLVLPEGTRLVHIGPHKTGTTSLQAALYAARPAMLEQAVRHLGKTRNPASAVRAVTGQAAPTSSTDPPSMYFWSDLVRDVRRAKEPRAVLSSEFFAWAKPPVIERIARDLDRDRLHVVVTLRPIGRILPSQWQQNVQAGALLDYGTWLVEVFGDKARQRQRKFWWLHRHDELIERWADVLGRDRVTAVVVDERDHAMLLRVFEGLLGLDEDTLRPDRDLSNRSMTLAEAEAIRSFNRAAREAGVSRAVHARTMRFGAAMYMKRRRPGADEARIDTPQWALDRAREANVEIVAGIKRSGIRVIGDLASLAAPIVSRGEADGQGGPVRVSPRVSAELAMGLVLASGLARHDGPHDGSIEPAEVASLSTWQLLAVVARRTTGRATRRFRQLRGRVEAGKTAR